MARALSLRLGTQRERWVCFACRKMFRPRRAHHAAFTKTLPPPVCADCHLPLRAVGRRFKPPRRLDKAQWRKAETLLNHGVTFYGYQPRPPQRPSEVEAYLAEYLVPATKGARLLDAIEGRRR